MKYSIIASVTIIFVISFGFLLPIMAEENLIPSWIKNIIKFWGEGDIDDAEFIGAIQYLIKNDIIILEPSDFKGYVTVTGDLFQILYPEKILENPIAMAGRIILNTQPFFALDNSKLELYDDIGNLDKSQNTVFIYPMFTQSAYALGGFYDYFENKCDDSCLTTEIYTDFEATYTSSGNSATILNILGYDFITDMDVDKDPSILNNFDKIILLHNEYVTKSMFEAISKHPKVIYLYPNALYAEIEVDYQQNTISLIRGHGYPLSEISNGFDWKFENTHPYEYDNECIDWEFYKIDNGIMLNCYPEHIIFKDDELLKQIKEY